MLSIGKFNTAVSKLINWEEDVMNKKYVYMFSEGNASMRNLLGGKGANLAEMTVMGLPIPQGFTVTTEACTEYNENGKKLSDEMISQIEAALVKLEEIAGKKLGDIENPLLVSVRVQEHLCPA